MKLDNSKQDILSLTDNRIMSPIMGVIFMVAGLIFFNYSGFDFSEPAHYIPVVAFIIGLIVFLVWKRKKVIFDKSLNIIQKTEKGWFKTKEDKYALNAISGVEYIESVSISHSSKGMSRKVTKSIDVLFSNGARYNIHSGGGGTLSLLSNSIKDDAQKIALFLGVPFQSKTPADLLKAVTNKIMN